MVGKHHQFNGLELGQTLGDGEGQGGLAGCSPWGRQESDTTGRLNNYNILYLPFVNKVLLEHGYDHWLT